MIDPQAYSASGSYGADQRTAGYIPGTGQKKAGEARAFDALVQGAEKRAQAGDAAKSADGGKKHHGFLEFLTTLFDIINPLEHLPIISTIYEHITGHHMNPVARIAGDTLYGGPIGAAVGIANVVSEKKTGKDLGENMLAMLQGHGHDKHSPATALAQNDAPKASDITWNDAPATQVADTPALQKATPAQVAQNSNARPAQKSLVPNFSSIAATRSHGATAGKQLAEYLSTVPPVNMAKGGPSADRGVPGGANTSLAADSTPGLSTQEAPADEAPPRAIPPGLIAKKMMEGLDKYAALKTQQYAAPSYSATF
jgi:hypothetical protein